MNIRMQNIGALGQNTRILASDIGAGNTIVNVTNGGQFFNNVGQISVTDLSTRTSILTIGIVLVYYGVLQKVLL